MVGKAIYTHERVMCHTGNTWCVKLWVVIGWMQKCFSDWIEYTQLLNQPTEFTPVVFSPSRTSSG